MIEFFGIFFLICVDIFVWVDIYKKEKIYCIFYFSFSFDFILIHCNYAQPIIYTYKSTRNTRVLSKFQKVLNHRRLLPQYMFVIFLGVKYCLQLQFSKTFCFNLLYEFWFVLVKDLLLLFQLKLFFTRHLWLYIHIVIQVSILSFHVKKKLRTSFNCTLIKTFLRCPFKNWDGTGTYRTDVFGLDVLDVP